MPAMGVRLTYLKVVVLVAAATSTSCSGPTAPEPIGLGAPLGLSAASDGRGVPMNFPVLGGTFRLGFSNGDYIAGTYTGDASVSNPGSDNAVLDLTVVEGSGAFQGASGSLTGDGRGAFSGEGTFWLSLKGSISTTTMPQAFSFSASLRGTSVVSCVDQRITLTLDGSGNVSRFGSVTVSARHQVGSTSCFS